MKIAIGLFTILLITSDLKAEISANEPFLPTDNSELGGGHTGQTTSEQFDVLTIQFKPQFLQALNSLSFETPVVESKFTIVMKSYLEKLAKDAEAYGRGESAFFLIDLLFKTSSPAGPVTSGGKTLEMVLVSNTKGSRSQSVSEILNYVPIEVSGNPIETYTGICGLLSVIHSMKGTFGCTWKDGEMSQKNNSFFNDSFIQAVANAAGNSDSGGTSPAMEKALHEDKDLWNCPAGKVVCGEEEELTAASLNNLRKKKQSGQDCTLRVFEKSYWLGIFPTYARGHVMHIQNIDNEKPLIRTTDTSSQGKGAQGNFTDIPRFPGKVMWKIKSGKDQIDGLDEPWNTQGHNVAFFMCCEIKKQ